MAQTLEELKQEMPLAFELREKLVSDIEAAELRFREKYDEMRARLTWEEFEEWFGEAYAIHRTSLVPMRQHIEYMNKQIVKVAATFAPQPIIIEREKKGDD